MKDALNSVIIVIIIIIVIIVIFVINHSSMLVGVTDSVYHMMPFQFVCHHSAESV